MMTYELMVRVAQEAMQPNKYCGGVPYLESWIKKFEKDALPRGLFKLFPVLESKKSKSQREKSKKSADLCRETYELVREVAQSRREEPDYYKPKLLGLEARFLDKPDEHYSFCSTPPPVVRDLLFQYPDIAREKLSHILQQRPEDVRCARLGDFETLCSYAKQFPELSREVMSAISLVYKADIERQKTKGKRRMAFFSPGAFVPISTASDCIMAIESLGSALGLKPQESYNVAGLDEESVKRYNKEWDELAVKQTHEKGLFSEFTD